MVVVVVVVVVVAVAVVVVGGDVGVGDDDYDGDEVDDVDVDEDENEDKVDDCEDGGNDTLIVLPLPFILPTPLPALLPDSCRHDSRLSLPFFPTFCKTPESGRDSAHHKHRLPQGWMGNEDGRTRIMSIGSHRWGTRKGQCAS